MLKKILLKPLLKGALIVVPIAATLWLLWSSFKWLNNLGLKALAAIKLDFLIFPGSGLVIMLVLLFLMGLLARISIVNWLYARIEQAMLRFPLVKTLYGGIKDLAGMFDNKKGQSQQTVLVQLGQLGLAVGFITNDQPPSTLQACFDEPHVAVYFPMSYNVGGYTAFIPKSRTKSVDWSFEEAMRFSLTAGVSQVSK
ncbi:DUF502 domain-containing protein [Marinicella rhabdoformis]|uniref:DUF502 domain-containing protein n=1 Tax=Marinicella rhabdoformis TaxID=2580566 RepID=UPI0012AEBB9A|nr:DUF502 domain-containing protein [Marinicella rhabdoformis]